MSKNSLDVPVATVREVMGPGEGAIHERTAVDLARDQLERNRAPCTFIGVAVEGSLYANGASGVGS